MTLTSRVEAEVPTETWSHLICPRCRASVQPNPMAFRREVFCEGQYGAKRHRKTLCEWVRVEIADGTREKLQADVEKLRGALAHATDVVGDEPVRTMGPIAVHSPHVNVKTVDLWREVLAETRGES